ncbi:UNVERIFIED_CONTAM: hypothetical protein Sindi_0056900 [Sesamum indicum]
MDENETKHTYVQHGEPDQKMEIYEKQTNKPKTTDSEHHKLLMAKLPLPEGFAENEEGEKKGTLETVSKLMVNIPLIDAIKRIPHYAKFLKEFCTSKCKLKDFIDPLVQEKTKFDGYKDFNSGPKTYKNKAFYDKISSRKNSFMNLKAFLGPHHLWVHYEEEVDLECPTYSS